MSGYVALSDLTEKQAGFVRLLCSGKQIGDAALAAGYSQPESGTTLLRLPHVVAAVQFEISRRLTAEMAPIAFNVARELLKDPTTGARVRADLSLKLLQMAGHGARDGKNDKSEKALSEMSAGELHEYLARNQAEIDRLERELASRATPVNAPNPTTIDAKPLTYLD